MSRRLVVLVGVLLGALAIGLPGAAVAKPKHHRHHAKKHKKHTVKVMTRNLYLGADLTPGVESNNFDELCDAAGDILHVVDATNFPLRAKGLASEIRGNKPDLVGLQEVAHWFAQSPATGIPGVTPGAVLATQNKYDFLKLLLAQVNKGKGANYRAVVIEPEFEFQVWANYNSGMSGCANADIDGRLQMRDVILARDGVKTKAPHKSHFSTLFQATPGGAGFDVNRGWTSTKATVRGRSFTFVNTHLEAFDDGTIRQAQAQELVAPGGPAAGNKPVILAGDLNSDDDTVVGNDQLAYNSLLGAGLKERTTANPLSCCQSNQFLTGGSAAEFDHQVDHIMVNKGSYKLLKSLVTGRTKVLTGTLWHSDHAGIVSTLKIP